MTSYLASIETLIGRKLTKEEIGKINKYNMLFGACYVTSDGEICGGKPGPDNWNTQGKNFD